MQLPVKHIWSTQWEPWQFHTAYNQTVCFKKLGAMFKPTNSPALPSERLPDISSTQREMHSEITNGDCIHESSSLLPSIPPSLSYASQWFHRDHFPQRMEKNSSLVLSGQRKKTSTGHKGLPFSSVHSNQYTIQPQQDKCGQYNKCHTWVRHIFITILQS